MDHKELQTLLDDRRALALLCLANPATAAQLSPEFYQRLQQDSGVDPALRDRLAEDIVQVSTAMSRAAAEELQLARHGVPKTPRQKPAEAAEPATAAGCPHCGDTDCPGREDGPDTAAFVDADVDTLVAQVTNVLSERFAGDRPFRQVATVRLSGAPVELAAAALAKLQAAGQPVTLTMDGGSPTLVFRHNPQPNTQPDTQPKAAGKPLATAGTRHLLSWLSQGLLASVASTSGSLGAIDAAVLRSSLDQLRQLLRDGSLPRQHAEQTEDSFVIPRATPAIVVDTIRYLLRDSGWQTSLRSDASGTWLAIRRRDAWPESQPESPPEAHSASANGQAATSQV